VIVERGSYQAEARTAVIANRPAASTGTSGAAKPSGPSGASGTASDFMHLVLLMRLTKQR